MKLADIKIKDFRSFPGERDGDLSSGTRYVVDAEVVTLQVALDYLGGLAGP